jgi:sulfur-carrier protein
MGITIALPGALQPYAGGSSEVSLAAGFHTVAEALAELGARHGGVMDRVMDERGALRPHVNLFVDGENVRFLDGLRTAVGDGTTIVIVPAVSGG